MISQKICETYGRKELAITTNVNAPGLAALERLFKPMIQKKTGGGEKGTCGAKGVRKYCIETSVANMLHALILGHTVRIAVWEGVSQSATLYLRRTLGAASNVNSGHIAKKRR